MNGQLEMTTMLEDLAQEWHARRAVKPSKLVPCVKNCGRRAWVATDAKGPYLCRDCQTGGQNETG